MILQGLSLSLFSYRELILLLLLHSVAFVLDLSPLSWIPEGRAHS